MIHQYQLNGYHIVLDVCSGAVHLVDGLAYDMIALYESKSREEITAEMLAKYRVEGLTESEADACYDEITALKDAGQLFTPDRFEPMAGRFKEKSGDVIKALCLHVAHTCNLNCSYCFASQGRYHGERAVMSPEVGRQALDFLIAHSGSRRNLEVDFFGGEPLMNFDTVKELVAYARKREKETGKNFRFTLTTNGMLIDDDVIDFANREMSNVVLSLDGRKEVHDRFRVDYAGNGSWERIVPKFQRLVRARGGKNYYMRGTFTHHNPDFVKDIRQMLDLGFTELSMEPVVCAPGDPSALTPADIEIVKQQYEELADLMLRRDREGRPFTFYHYMLDLAGGPCIYKRISGCGSGTEYMAWGKSASASAMSFTVWITRRSGMSSAPAMSMPSPSAVHAGPDSTAPAAAQPTPGMPPAASPASMRPAVSFFASAWNARSCWRRPVSRTPGKPDDHSDLRLCPAL